jgi:16S rRNA G1207 methylase RsmC
VESESLVSGDQRLALNYAVNSWRMPCFVTNHSQELFKQMSLRRKQVEDPTSRVPVQEQMLTAVLRELAPKRLLCTSVGRGQTAIAASEAFHDCEVTCHFMDLFYASATQALATMTNLKVVCTPDFPAETFDHVLIPIRSSGDAELARDRLQSGHIALEIGGRLITATDNEKDTWLHGEMKKLFPKVTRRPLDEGVVYLATKTEPLKKIKNFECEFAFRDQGRLLRLISRPGVFNHRKLDGGARALIKAMTVNEGDRVLDIGCGCGAVAIAAASRFPSVQALAVDSDCRAVHCTERGAALNELTNVTTALNCNGDAGIADTYDLVVGNPPYFSQYQIAFLFLRAAFRALKEGGRVMMVTKTPNWFDEHMPEWFQEIDIQPVSNYYIASGRKTF